MAYTTINKSSLHMNTKIYTGDSGTNNSITGIGFRPDMVWIKNRTGSGNHYLWDVVRGANKTIVPNDTDAEETSSYLGSFNSDGFTLTSASNNTNSSSYNYASWNWKAGNSQGSSNTAGSINTAYTSVNTTAGFSISKYTGNGSSGATIGHGLGVAPSMIIARRLNGVEDWAVYHKTLGASKYIILNTTGAQQSSTSRWGGGTPTNNVFTLGNHASVNTSGGTHIAYCFAEKQGYSKFGSYTGNGNANGTFVYTGFKPSFVLQKMYEASANGNWTMHDNRRSSSNGFNHVDKTLYPHLANSEDTGTGRGMDMLSNGFKFTGNDEGNTTNQKCIYMAFGQTLVGTNGVPATAR